MGKAEGSNPPPPPYAKVHPSNDPDVDHNSYSLEKFRLYETRARYYLIGSDRYKKFFRVLKIDRSEPSELNISEDPVVYSLQEIRNLRQRIAEGNRATGGLSPVTKAFGIAGCIKCLESYYLILVTKRRQIGCICGHAIYGIDETQLITVPHVSVQTDVAHSKTELRYKKLLSSVDLTKDFFYSYTYPIMQSLQKNAMSTAAEGMPYDNIFVWNAYLTRAIRSRCNNTAWTIALVHGHFKQVRLSIFGRDFTITLISRRSRHFAGTRYLKRGVNDRGHVANDVETEQIVLDEEAGSCKGKMSSVVQMRGSIPLFWSQEASKFSPKPDIILQRYDPTYQATKLHFEDLAERYGNPIIVLNLIKVGLSPAIQNLSTATSMKMTKVFQAFLMLQPQLVDLIHEMQPDCIVSDVFYPWTSDVAAELRIPRLAFNGSSFFSYCAEQCIKEHKPHLEVESNNEKFKLPGLPDVIEMVRSELPSWITRHKPDGFSQLLDVIRESEKRCYGMLMNRFHELEASYEEHLNKIIGIKTWSIGPVSLLANNEIEDKESRGGNPNIQTTNLLQWLNEKEPNSVLYINFGSLIQMSRNQITEIAHAIQESSQSFIWVIKKNDEDNDDDIVNKGLQKGFEERMSRTKKGLIIKGWAPQLMILEHKSVGGFLTHCGWNSILEGISSGLPMITWPLFAEQFYNEKLLIEVVKIGVGVGSKKWWHLGEEPEIIKREEIGKAIAFLMGESVEALEMRELKKWERLQKQV